ncbi:MAG: nitrogen fixation protein NifQ [Alphaproteobacteria bacterium]|jgi:nitrogen fixation protein NifQ|nr:nitrogen fixation protein NifQ [Alphaproteobacteria bacterium]
MDFAHLAPADRENRATATAGAVPARSAEEPSDSDLFERTVGIATQHAGRPLTEALGLDRAALARLLTRHLPGHRADLLATVPPDAGSGEEALEEPDVRAYLLECRGGRDDDAESWWAAILARRSLQPNHLWQDMGFRNRGELGIMLRRHFPELVRRNHQDMKWKKFLYRELCKREGIVICKSPVCACCSDFQACFGGEPGEPLHALAAVSGPKS